MLLWKRFCFCGETEKRADVFFPFFLRKLGLSRTQTFTVFWKSINQFGNNMVALQVLREKLVNPENPIEGETNVITSNERKAGLTLNLLRMFTGIAAFLSMVWSTFVSGWVAVVLLFSIKVDFSDGVNSTTVFISGFINLIMTYLSYGLIWITLFSGNETDPCPPRFWNFLPNPKFILICLYSGLANFVYHLVQFYFSPNSSYFTDFTEFVIFLFVYYIILLTVSVYLAVLRCKRPACFQN